MTNLEKGCAAYKLQYQLTTVSIVTNFKGTSQPRKTPPWLHGNVPVYSSLMFSSAKSLCVCASPWSIPDWPKLQPEFPPKTIEKFSPFPHLSGTSNPLLSFSRTKLILELQVALVAMPLYATFQLRQPGEDWSIQGPLHSSNPQGQLGPLGLL